MIFDEIRKTAYKLLAFGNNQACHQNEPYMQSNAQEPLDELFKKINAKKVELLDMIPRIIVICLTHKFPDEKDKVTPPAEGDAPADENKEATLYGDAEKIIVA